MGIVRNNNTIPKSVIAAQVRRNSIRESMDTWETGKLLRRLCGGDEKERSMTESVGEEGRRSGARESVGLCSVILADIILGNKRIKKKLI